MTDREPPRGAQPVNLDEVQRLVDALERDLAKARADAGGVEVLREEVEALRKALSAEQPRQDHVRERLHGVRGSLEQVGETLYDDVVKLGDYLKRIGWMLGDVADPVLGRPLCGYPLHD